MPAWTVSAAYRAGPFARYRPGRVDRVAIAATDAARFRWAPPAGGFAAAANERGRSAGRELPRGLALRGAIGDAKQIMADHDITPATRELSRELYRIGAVRFGSFTLKDGRESPFYLDLRILVSHSTTLARVGRALAKRAEALSYDRIAGIPYAGLPIAVAMALVAQQPIVYPRKEAKDYGTKKAVEGEFAFGETALVVDDVITSGLARSWRRSNSSVRSV